MVSSKGANSILSNVKDLKYLFYFRYIYNKRSEMKNSVSIWFRNEGDK